MLNQCLLLCQLHLLILCRGIDIIVQFDSYYVSEQRSRIISRAISNIPFANYTILKRRNEAYQLSDFDVISVDKSFLVRIPELERSHKLIRRVSSDGRHFVISSLDDNHEKQDASRRARDVSNSSFLDFMEIRKLHKYGHTGKGIRVAVFDTGLSTSYANFKSVEDIIDWTDDNKDDDIVGHGTFVAGVIAGSGECPGIAPDATLLVSRVFNSKRVSRTSWFLDAFNYALRQNVDVLNLSIGGPDYSDVLFTDKVSELVSSGVVFVSAIGNDGPSFGTLNNPADQLDVIGVGAVDLNDCISSFSSRGMTTWTLPKGYGRAKPDIVTYGIAVSYSISSMYCTEMTGTSVASPIVAGAVALLMSSLESEKRNPAFIKQAIMSTASKLKDASVFEQGAGKLNITKAIIWAADSQKSVTLHPSYIDATESRYFWPYSQQPLYHSSMPVIYNITVINSFGVSGRLSKIEWRPSEQSMGIIEMSFSDSGVIWPWTGYVALTLRVSEPLYKNTIVEGKVIIGVETYVFHDMWKWLQVETVLPVRIRVASTPPRHRRVLWDQFHSLRYPSGYFPRDDLKLSTILHDWTSDHPHTNFMGLFSFLRSKGFFVEVLTEPFYCFNAENYGTLLMIDPEDEFYITEASELLRHVYEDGLSFFVVADWWNQQVIDKVKYFDENTRSWNEALTGGTNIPALNDLLKVFNISFSDHIYSGDLKGAYSAKLRSASSIIRFPDDGFLVRTDLKDEAYEITEAKSRTVKGVPIAGISELKGETSGNIAVFTDSSCLDDMSSPGKKCYQIFHDLLLFAATSEIAPLLPILEASRMPNFKLPARKLNDNRLAKVSQVVSSLFPRMERPMPACEKLTYSAGVSLDDDFDFDSLKSNKLFPQVRDEIPWSSIAADSEAVLERPLQDIKSYGTIENDQPYILLLCAVILPIFVLFIMCHNFYRRRRRRIRAIISSRLKRLFHI